MNKLMKVFLVGLSFLLIGNIVRAQNKIGYINLNQLIDQMPETKTIRSQVEAYQKQFIDELTSMNNDYQSKGKAYEAQRATITDAVRTSKEAELSNLQKRMNDYQTSAQQQVQAKTNELSKPLFDKVRTAVSQLAKEKGYTYVFDTSQTDFIVSPQGDDLLNDAKAKLGIK
ncbi:MAG: OmpH family outer membrane protein [Sphingobacteriales bacterium]